jgi:hypothetical protein
MGLLLSNVGVFEDALTYVDLCLWRSTHVCMNLRMIFVGGVSSSRILNQIRKVRDIGWGGKSPLQRCQNIPENESSWVQEFLDGPPPNQEVQETDQA